MRKILQKLRIGGLTGLALLSGACATNSGLGREQLIYVESNPPGVRVLQKGRNLGETPGLVRIQRGRTAELVFERGSQEKRVELPGRYRWSESFFANLVFLSYAPIGWITDLVTGAAYENEDPKPVFFGNASRSRQSSTDLGKAVILIAPPVGESVLASDEAARFWSQELRRRYPGAQILDYRDTLNAFLDRGFDYDAKSASLDRRRQLLYETQADEIFFSDVTFKGSDLWVKGYFENAKGEKVAEIDALSVNGEKSEQKLTSWKRELDEWFEIVPNNFGVEASGANDQLRVARDPNEITYVSQQISDRTTIGSVFSSLEGISIGRLQVPRLDQSWRFKFSFTSAARFSYRHFYFPEFSELALVDFRYFRVGAGIGPELGWSNYRSYFYLKMIPLISYHQISWNQPGGGREVREVTPLETQVELGYIYFYNEKINFRAFSRSVSGSTDLWNGISQRINPMAPKITSPSEVIAGLAFGYNFDLRRIF